LVNTLHKEVIVFNSATNQEAVMSKIVLAALSLILSFGSVTAQASIITYGNQGAFNALGTIAHNTNFQSAGSYFTSPGNPYTVGDVTYHSFDNLIWGSSTQYTNTEPLIGNNYWTPILGSIATGPRYNMFGFDIGTYNTSPITITLDTNLGAYVYPSLHIVNSQAGLLEFEGFVASAGEYFTGFNITADNGPGNLPGITHVEVGQTGGAPVPEPSTISLLGAGLAAVGMFGRKARKS
jgi:hypothetical protein